MFTLPLREIITTHLGQGHSTSLLIDPNSLHVPTMILDNCEPGECADKKVEQNAKKKFSLWFVVAIGDKWPHKPQYFCIEQQRDRQRRRWWWSFQPTRTNMKGTRIWAPVLLLFTIYGFKIMAPEQRRGLARVVTWLVRLENLGVPGSVITLVFLLFVLRCKFINVWSTSIRCPLETYKHWVRLNWKDFFDSCFASRGS